MATLTIPNNFTPSTLIKSGEVNANFTAIATFMNVTKLDAGNLQNGAIGAGGNNDLSTHIVDGTTLALASNQLSIATGGVGTGQMADASITTAKIEDQQVTFPKRTSRVYAANGADPGVGGISVAQSCGSFSTSATSFTQVTHQSLTLTTAGGPVRVFCQDDGTTTSNIACGISSGDAEFVIEVDGANIKTGFTLVSTSRVPPSSIYSVLSLAAGTHTIALFAKVSAGGGTASCTNLCLSAIEE